MSCPDHTISPHTAVSISQQSNLSGAQPENIIGVGKKHKIVAGAMSLGDDQRLSNGGGFHIPNPTLW
jgi:hypothetical protein